jgi:hypothetical protein
MQSRGVRAGDAIIVCSTRFESAWAYHIFQWVNIHNLTLQMALLKTPSAANRDSQSEPLEAHLC